MGLGTETLSAVVPEDLEGGFKLPDGGLRRRIYELTREGRGPLVAMAMAIKERAPAEGTAARERVSKAISRFRAEGIPQEQAIAKALAMEREGRLDDNGDYVPMSKAEYRAKGGAVRRGTPIRYGARGATVIDHETGEAVRVDHGHYLHPPEETAGEGDGWKARARKHLELGPRHPSAVHALAALAMDAGVEQPHRLARKDIRVDGNRLSIRGKAIDDPYAAATARWLVAQDTADSDVFSWRRGAKRTRLSDTSLAAYRARCGALDTPETAPDREAVRLAAKPKAKVKAAPKPRIGVRAGAMRKAAVGIRTVDRWSVGEYTAIVQETARGVRSLSIAGGNLPIPFHVLVADADDARRKAPKLCEVLAKGQTPRDGLFRAMNLPDRLPGGKGDGRPDDAFDAEQLRVGTEHELEHTTNRAVAREIAKDHLTEDPAYYRKLRKVER